MTKRISDEQITKETFNLDSEKQTEAKAVPSTPSVAQDPNRVIKTPVSQMDKEKPNVPKNPFSNLAESSTISLTNPPVAVSFGAPPKSNPISFNFGEAKTGGTTFSFGKPNSTATATPSFTFGESKPSFAFGESKSPASKLGETSGGTTISFGGSKDQAKNSIFSFGGDSNTSVKPSTSTSESQTKSLASTFKLSNASSSTEPNPNVSPAKFSFSFGSSSNQPAGTSNQTSVPEIKAFNFQLPKNDFQQPTSAKEFKEVTKSDLEPKDWNQFCKEVTALNYSVYRMINETFEKTFKSGIVSDSSAIRDLTKPFQQYAKYFSDIQQKHRESFEYWEKKQTAASEPATQSSKTVMSGPTTHLSNMAGTSVPARSTTALPNDEDGGELEEDNPELDKSQIEKFKTGQGEEEESDAIELRCKLYKMEDKVPKDIGINFLKLKLNKENKARLLARQEGSGLVTINSKVNDSTMMKISKKNEKYVDAVLLVGEIGENGEGILQQYAVRSKNADLVEKLMDLINQYK